jgi:hypothetical protein
MHRASGIWHRGWPGTANKKLLMMKDGKDAFRPLLFVAFGGLMPV